MTDSNLDRLAPVVQQLYDSVDVNQTAEAWCQPANQWYHVSVVKTASTTQVYVNGQDSDQGADRFRLGDDACTVHITNWGWYYEQYADLHAWIQQHQGSWYNDGQGIRVILPTAHTRTVFLMRWS